MVDWQSVYAERVAMMKASDIRDAFRLAERPDIISFAGGFPAPDSFPVQRVSAALAGLLATDAAVALQYGPTEGLSELRRMIADSMCRAAVSVTAENVLVTNGSQQALDLVCKLFVNPNSPVIVELPGYIGGISAAVNYEARLIGIPIDEDGMITAELELCLAQMEKDGQQMPRLAYVVPNFQNPAGVTLALERRQHLLRLAQRYNFLIIEDNPYGALRYEGEAVAHIKSLDTEGRVFYLGSFSKTFIPGVRLGYVVADEQVIKRLVVAKQGTDLCTNSLGQRLVCECERRGWLDQHVESLCDIYRRRRDLALFTMEQHFPSEVSWTKPQGGFFIWITLPGEMDARQLLPQAITSEGVAYVPGSGFFVDGSGRNTIRLAFSQVDEAMLCEGIRRLGRFLKRNLHQERSVAITPPEQEEEERPLA